MLASLVVEHTRDSIFLFGVAGLNVHGNHKVEETELLVGELVDKSAVLQQFRVAVGQARVIIVSSDIVGFQCLLDSLVTEECYVEPVASLKETLGCADVLVYVVEPFLDDVFFCHIRVTVYTFRLQRYNFFPTDDTDYTDFFALALKLSVKSV